MTKFRHIAGTGVALVTPFKSDKSVDFDALKKLVNHVIEGGVDFLVVMGTTAEAATLSADERVAVLNEIVKINNKKLPIVLGMGGNNTELLSQQIKEADLSNVDALLSVCPYYNKPNQAGLYEHFKRVSESTDKSIILYNVPGRTGADLAAETTLRLANDFDNIVAVKEASGNLDKAMEIISQKPNGFTVLSGEDALNLPLISLGMEGVISVVANAYPWELSNLVLASRQGNLSEARLFHYLLLKMTHLMFQEGNPVGVKAVLSQMEIIQNELRLPLVKSSELLSETIRKEVDKIQSLK
ncbi:MAG: 4-hydroxy-tetrahydrodipicolinate synthase [Bacteroidales bacterium]|jgi:4-hydroxy-tetrahydrodipicolinate synthase|nr:4-hydroxy-tetrahydrodipicolinate synthase [Bacteroidales bacterium]